MLFSYFVEFSIDLLIQVSDALLFMQNVKLHFFLAIFSGKFSFWQFVLLYSFEIVFLQSDFFGYFIDFFFMIY